MIQEPFKEYSKMISIKKLQPCQFDVIREIDRNSDPQYIALLRRDIVARGILVPLMVREAPGGKYDVICGNTRYFIADFEFRRKNKHFEKLRCDVLRDDMTTAVLEVTAILDNMNRRMIVATGKHLMIARYKEQLRNILAPHRDGSGRFVPKDQLPRTSDIDNIIETFQKGGDEHPMRKYVSDSLGVSPSVVDSADVTVAALRLKINEDSGTQTPIGKTESNRVERVVEELSRAPDGWTKEIYNRGPRKLVKEYYEKSSITAPTTPKKTETVTDKDWPGDWRKTEGEVYKRIRRADTSKYTPRFTVSVKWWKKKEEPY